MSLLQPEVTSHVNKDDGGVNGLSLPQGPEVTSHVNKPNLPLPPLAIRRQILLSEGMTLGLKLTLTCYYLQS